MTKNGSHLQAEVTLHFSCLVYLCSDEPAMTDSMFGKHVLCASAGEMIVMDNYRVLHGRQAYQEGKGERHIVSGYWDWDAVKSKRRVLRSVLANS